MKKILFLSVLFLSGCVSLSYYEKDVLQDLSRNGISADVSAEGWEKLAYPVLAGILNILPGFGNFYLGFGDAAEPIQSAYGGINLLFWPLSVVWSVPQAYIDAKNINKRNLVEFYQRNKIKKKHTQNSLEKIDFPQWVDLYEKEGYIGQTDNNAVHYIGYGESVLYNLAHDQAVSDAYEKANASITGYPTSVKKVPIHGMHLISEYKNESSRRVRVWVLYSYPKIQMEKDILNYQKSMRK